MGQTTWLPRCGGDGMASVLLPRSKVPALPTPGTLPAPSSSPHPRWGVVKMHGRSFKAEQGPPFALWAADPWDHEAASGMEATRAEQGRTDRVCLAAHWAPRQPARPAPRLTREGSGLRVV